MACRPPRTSPEWASFALHKPHCGRALWAFRRTDARARDRSYNIIKFDRRPDRMPVRTKNWGLRTERVGHGVAALDAQRLIGYVRRRIAKALEIGIEERTARDNLYRNALCEFNGPVRYATCRRRADSRSASSLARVSNSFRRRSFASASSAASRVARATDSAIASISSHL